MSRIASVEERLRSRPERWLVTGGAGFLGSHLVQRLLALGQEVVVLDDLSTGTEANLEAAGHPDPRLRVLRGDIRDPAACRAAMEGVDRVLHQAALGSVPRSLDDPRSSHAVNVDGFLEVLEAARQAGVRALVYASSSSVYGARAALPAREEALPAPISPYAATKASNELIARAWCQAFGLRVVGLRYFNVCGARQDPEGSYAAVIPRWIRRLVRGLPPQIFGDGQVSRDFCPVDDAVQANLLAALGPDRAMGRVFNVALGRRTTLLQLLGMIRAALAARGVQTGHLAPVHLDPRPGDVPHTHADLAAIRRVLGYAPQGTLEAALDQAVAWELRSRAPAAGGAVAGGVG